MNIVVPYRDVTGRDISSSVVSGGIERFVRHLRDELAAVTVDVTRLYKDDPRKMAQLVEEKAKDADLVICNYPNRFLNVDLNVRCPIVWVNHHTAGTYPDSEGAARRMSELTAINPANRLWMVSRKQADDWIALGHRFGVDVKCHGIMPPSMVKGVHFHSGVVKWEVVTIGRCDKLKDPFLVHEVAKKAKMKSLVMTTWTATEYSVKNQDWMGRQDTGWDWAEATVSRELNRSGVYLVTWPDETFGIAPLEALSHGVPVVIYAPNGRHACEELIPNCPWIVKARTKEEIAPLLNEMNQIEMGDRTRLALRAFDLHGLSKWRVRLRELVA